MFAINLSLLVESFWGGENTYQNNPVYWQTVAAKEHPKLIYDPLVNASWPVYTFQSPPPSNCLRLDAKHNGLVGAILWESQSLQMLRPHQLPIIKANQTLLSFCHRTRFSRLKCFRHYIYYYQDLSRHLLAVN